MTEVLLITSSNIVALWQLIVVSSKYEGISIEEAIAITRNSGLIGGGLPVNEGLKLGRHCNLLEIDHEKKLFSSNYCKDYLLPGCDTDEPNIFIIRSLLFRYVSIQNLDWLLFFNEDLKTFKASIPSDWIDLLEYAVLFDFDDTIVREWWAEVFSRFQTYKEGKKLEIGKVAEKLTFEFEKQRLNQDGLVHDHSFVKWASQLSDKYGYDVLSIRGTLLKFLFSEKDKVQIEVKSSVSSTLQEFRFYVTKPEWNTALRHIDSYFFYCWVSTNLDKQTAFGPFIIPAKQLEPHIPNDISNSLCEWSECRFVVDLKELSFQQ